MTVFVTLTDASYFPKAKRTLHELRTVGGWEGDVVLMHVDFDPDPMEGVILHKVRHIDHVPLFQAWKSHPIRPMDDGRHYNKTYQWDKLHIFSSYFSKWDRVIFLDAGMRVCNSVGHLLSIPWEYRFLSPDDSKEDDNEKRLNVQFDLKANERVTATMMAEFGTEAFTKRYFLNCLFIFDTRLLNIDSCYETLKTWMYKYPISLCNEMGIMNLFFTAKHTLWTPLPRKITDGSKYLFGWSELDFPERPGWKSFCFIKYSVT